MSVNGDTRHITGSDSKMGMDESRTTFTGLAIVAAVALVAIVLAAVALSRNPTTNISLGESSSQDQAGMSSALTGTSGLKKKWLFAIGHDYSPFEYVNEQGYTDGFNKDLISAVCQQAGMQCSTVYLEYPQCWNGIPGKHPVPGPALMDNWVDACTGWYVSQERLNSIAYSTAFMKSIEANFLVKKSDNSFNPNDLRGRTVGFLDGWVNDEKCLLRQNNIANNDLAVAQVKHYTHSGESYKALDNNEIAGLFHSLDATVDLNKYKWVGARYSCMIKGLSMMTKKDSLLAQWWDPAFNMVKEKGIYNQICKEAPKKHAGNEVDIELDCLD
ncbi:PREDICTED: histidine-binding periplasmic protein-like [Priapulus caudatus]|uniref:Histidine-binding periplasmic protein-like n=1 Tax=Priapulus caudatus TaxID=37621 RepID=A0ABM1DRC0_PRICU|nr:PREDICTED: histidine-binding periplasmic protein-like [Priapulus caudatus]XP_014662491.1 PREDICTED: histidine-binding periplasmic protein-like [Priapulus caudatus]XP_014662492.1 PREDICTED: histidine-binding periplasmic protein-like [Priapulus caudatus]